VFRADFLLLSPSEFNEERLFLGKSRAEIERFNDTDRKSAPGLRLHEVAHPIVLDSGTELNKSADVEAL
jgi:hypothetical protein